MRSRIWQWGLFLGMAAVMVATFFWVPVLERPVWKPEIKEWGRTPWPLFRIMIFHVPVAWVTGFAFLLASYYSARVLRRADPLADLKAVTAVELGLLFGLLATISGSIWARFEWGTYWNWDPRQTSILLLLLIYVAYLALRSALPETESRARISAVYALAAFVAVPFLMFVIPRVVESLHPAPIFDRQGRLQMNTKLLIVSAAAFACFTGLFLWIFQLRVAVTRMGELAGRGEG